MNSAINHKNTTMAPDQGLSLIEVMFSIAILGVALVAVIGMVVQAYEANLLNRHRAVALDEARGVLEEMRAIRQDAKDPETFQKTLGATYPEGRRRYLSPVLDQAARLIRYRDIDRDPIIIDVEVQWLDIRGRRMSVALSTALSQHP
jgi:prepilin-type N-terminal cleavage/methylation domain-containing protein